MVTDISDRPKGEGAWREACANFRPAKMIDRERPRRVGYHGSVATGASPGAKLLDRSFPQAQIEQSAFAVGTAKTYDL